MSAWGGPPSSGAWANQVDEEEEENGGELAPVPTAPKEAFPSLGGQQNFPALGDALSSKENRRDRKKKQATQKMSLTAFMSAAKKEPEIINLPTAPRARVEGEDDRKQGGLGGGFKNYGGDRGDRYGDRDRDDGFKGMEDDGPSRADAVDDWGSKKAFVPSDRAPSRGFGDGGFKDRERGGGGFSDRYSERRTGFGEGDLNRADDADRWNNKSFEPSTSRRGGFEDRDSGRDRERYGGFSGRDDFGPSKADSEDRWARQSTSDGIDRRDSGTASGQRPKLSLKPRSADLPVPVAPATSSRASEASTDDAKGSPLASKPSGPKSNPFGQAKPVDIKEKVEEQRLREKEDERQSREPSPVPSAPRPRSNPFGSARPREEVLKEKLPQTSSELEAEDTQDTAVADSKPEPEEQEEGVPKNGKTGSQAEKAGNTWASESHTAPQAESLVAKTVENVQSAVETVREKLENGLKTSEEARDSKSQAKPEAETKPPTPANSGSTWAKIASA